MDLKDLNIRCERCPLTFVSRVNYNRHRVEHAKLRSTSTQEEQTREKLAKFWNTLNVEEQKEVLSVEGGGIVTGVEFTGPVIKKSLENFAKNFLVLGLLQIPDSEKNYYMTASPLLDIVKAAPSRFPISVEDLSSILNNGSEGTFLLGEVSSVEKAMFDKEDGSLDVVASICFILEKQLLKKECEYSKLQMQLLEEIANEQAQQLIKEEAALKRDQEKKKKKKKKKGQQGSNVETPATLPIEGAGEIVVDDEPAGEAALKSDQEKTKKKGQIESNIETPQTEPVIESSQTTESTSETCILVGPSNTTYEVDETSNEFWYKVVEGGRTMLDEVGVMPICALYTIRILSQMLREISVWDGDRFHIVYQKMLRDIILIIVRLEREGIRTGTLGDEDIQIIFGGKLVEQQTRVLNNIEVKTDSKLLRGEFINLVVRLKQQREGVKEIPEELTCFLELISLHSRWNVFELLVHHPWLMSVMERFFFPYRCWVQMQLVYNYPWEPKFRSMTPPDFDLESEVNKMEDCFKKIYNNEVYNHKEKRKEKIQYENNYVGLLLFCKNVIVHFNKDSMTSESVQKRVNDFLGNHFPYLWLALFQFFVSEDISLNFKFANEEEFIKMSEEPEYRCFIGDLAWSTSDRSLKKAFDKHGKVVEAKVVVDKLSGRSRGYGFITFADKKAMEEAIEEMNGIDLDGRTITVEKAQPHEGSGRDYDGARSHDLDRGRDYGGGRGSDGGGVCFNCGKPGHFARECPSREVSRGGGSRYGDRDEKFSGGGGGGCGSRYGDRYSGCSRDSGSGDRSSSGSDRFRCDRSGPYERRGRGGYRSE